MVQEYSHTGNYLQPVVAIAAGIQKCFFFGVPGNKNQSQTAKYQLDICISAGPDFKLSLELIRKFRFANRAFNDSHQLELEEVPIC